MSKRYIVIGAGISGICATELLIRNGESVTIYDGNEKLNRDDIISKNPLLKEADFILGDITEDDIRGFDKAVTSPGVPLDTDVIKLIRKNDIPLWGEIELAYNYSKGRIVGITGTNGKTTTTALTGEILSSYYSDVRTVGNIGIPYTKMVMDSTDDTIFVIELSSFQLETINAFRPDVSAILNITPDHLNRHITMDNYISAKKNITMNQGELDTCILNYEDEVLRDIGRSISANVIYFSSGVVLGEGLFVKDGTIIYSHAGTTDSIIDTDKLSILGKHNHENAMCAIAAALVLNVPIDSIRSALIDFKAVEHRIEYVCNVGGVRFYNDSKATNPDAAIKGICAMDRPTYLIGGGYDKESTYDEWVECFEGRVKKLVLIGATRDKIAACAKKHGFCDVVYADSLEGAVSICYSEATSGDAVLLSPACASWDMFDSYEERGRLFKDYARSCDKTN